MLRPRSETMDPQRFAPSRPLVKPNQEAAVEKRHDGIRHYALHLRIMRRSAQSSHGRKVMSVLARYHELSVMPIASLLAFVAFADRGRLAADNTK